MLFFAFCESYPEFDKNANFMDRIRENTYIFYAILFGDKSEFAFLGADFG